jgi:DNA replication protein DnaC
MSPTDELIPLLKRIRFSGLLDSLDLRIKQAIDEKLSYPEFLYRVVRDESERRDSKQLDMRLRKANFEHAKTIEDFDFAFNPGLPQQKVIDLATCAFVKRRRNALVIGDTGVGKSHVAQAVGHRACLNGANVLFTSAQKMFSLLRAARADNTYDQKLARLIKPELLIIDDLGLRNLQHDEPMDLYEVIRGRYELGALLITSNRAIEEWPPLFGDSLLASAAMDRLLHDASIVVMTGDSFRNPPRTKRDRKVKTA